MAKKKSADSDSSTGGSVVMPPGIAVELEGVGPIAYAAIPATEGGGIVVLRGLNGKGKSHALRATEYLATGGKAGKLTKSDRVDQLRVRGFGGEVRLNKAASIRGEIGVEYIEGGLIGKLIDPLVEDPYSADRQRIEALVSLAGVQITSEQAAKVVGGLPAKRLVPICEAHGDRPIELVATLKKELQAVARELESEADRLDGEAKALRETHSPLRPKATRSVEVLSELFGTAAAEKSRLEAGERALQTERPQYEKAKAVVAEAGSLRLKEELEIRIRENTLEIERLEELLTKLRNQKATDSLELEKHNSIQFATERVTDYEAREKEFTPAAIFQAAANLKAIEEEREEARTSSTWQADEDRLESLKATAQAKRKKAADAREEAKGADRLLSGMVGDLGFPFSVKMDDKGARLCTETPRAPDELFADLSDGQRATAVVQVATSLVGKGAYLEIPQHVWEGIDELNRERLWKECRKNDVHILTAEHSLDERLTPAVYKPAKEG